MLFKQKYLSLVYYIFDWPFETLWEDGNHSLEPWKFLDTHFTLTFSFSGSYFAIIMIVWDIAKSQMYMAMTFISLLISPSILIRYDSAVVLSTWKWTAFRQNILWKIDRTRFLASSYNRLISNFESSRVHWPPTNIFWQHILQPPCEASDLAIVLFCWWQKFVSHYIFLGCLPTIVIPELCSHWDEPVTDKEVVFLYTLLVVIADIL